MVPALQLEGVFAPAQAADVGAQLVHPLQPLRHHHLLVHQVGLGQVGAGLGTTRGGVQPPAALRLQLASGCGYLDVDQQLQQVPGGHDDGGVEREDVALVQALVVVGGQALVGRHTARSPPGSAGSALVLVLEHPDEHSLSGSHGRFWPGLRPQTQALGC